MEDPDARSYNSGRAKPVVDLPKHVPAPTGKLTLFADFSAKVELPFGPPGGNSARTGIPLYLVNRTAKPVALDSQDGDIHMMLERRREDGTWERAQEYFPSFCDMSYFSKTLGPAQFFSFYGFMPSQGTQGQVRFGCYGNIEIVSNDAAGLFSENEIMRVLRDPKSRCVPFFLQLALDPPGGDLSRADVHPEERVAALFLVKAGGKNPYWEEAAAKWAERYEAGPSGSAAEKDAAREIRKILAEPWPEKRDLAAMRDRCVQALGGPGAKNALFGAPETQRTLAWRVLTELAQWPGLEGWAPAVNLVCGPDRPSDYALGAGILEVPRVADESIPDAVFETMIFDSDARLPSICANALSRRQRWDRLVEIGWKLDDRQKLIILGALARPHIFDDLGREIGSTRSPDKESEAKFWDHCTNSDPLEAAFVLSGGMSSEYNSYDRRVHDPLRVALLGEANRGAAAPEDFDLGSEKGYRMRCAVQLLASWRMEEDIPVFEKLLEHRGYEREEGSKSDGGPLQKYVAYNFRIREEARAALLKQGVPVAKELVLKKDVSVAPE